MDPETILAILAFAIVAVLGAALHRQTKRADAAEAALEKFEATIAECESDATLFRPALEGQS